MKRILIPSVVIFSLIAVFLFACKKDPVFNESDDISLSTDKILFDTVFTTVGSTTSMFYIKNSTSKNILTDISLAGGSTSNFRINVDGMAGTSFTDVEVPANDSIFIFVKVTVDPNGSNSPLVINDSIVFSTNGHVQDVNLVAWGQDAHYIIADTWLNGGLKYKIVAGEGEEVTWTADKPYLVYGYAVVDSTGRLNIPAGVKVHFYNGSGLWVYKGGCLRVNGTADDPVIFQGPRLEPAYSEMPGQWDRIWINESAADNVIDHAIIKNGFIGIQTETLDAGMGNKLILSNTQIRNFSGAGLLSKFYRITAYNCIISNCGSYAASLTTGGSYDFRHCTIGNYWSYTTRQTPSLLIMDYYRDPATQTIYSGDLDSAYFGNCIIYGNLESELVTDSVGGNVFNYFFENCLIKSAKLLDNPLRFSNVYQNQDPMFTASSNNDYRLMAGSAAIDRGSINIINSSIYNLAYDIFGNSRLINPPPDLGAIDYRP